MNGRCALTFTTIDKTRVVTGFILEKLVSMACSGNVDERSQVCIKMPRGTEMG